MGPQASVGHRQSTQPNKPQRTRLILHLFSQDSQQPIAVCRDGCQLNQVSQASWHSPGNLEGCICPGISH